MRTSMAMVLVLGVSLVACSSKTASPPAATGERVSDVGSVVVTIASPVTADAGQTLDEVNAGPRLKTAIEAQLGKTGKLKSGSSRVLEIEVIEFRLRSGATVFLAGIMAGVDTLQFRATVRENGRIVRQFVTGDSTSGGFAGLSSSSRYQTMADAASERLATEL